jgi:hypothetical protein
VQVHSALSNWGPSTLDRTLSNKTKRVYDSNSITPFLFYFIILFLQEISQETSQETFCRNRICSVYFLGEGMTETEQNLFLQKVSCKISCRNICIQDLSPYTISVQMDKRTSTHPSQHKSAALERCIVEENYTYISCLMGRPKSLNGWCLIDRQRAFEACMHQASAIVRPAVQPVKRNSEEHQS